MGNGNTPEIKERLPDSLIYDYQNGVDQGSTYAFAHSGNLWEWLYVILGIVGEGGEVAEQAKKLLRKAHSSVELQQALADRIPKLFDEAGDVLWYIVRLSSLYGLSLRSMMIYNTVKLHQRHAKVPGDDSWPLKDLSYADALKLMQHIESQIMRVSASISTDTAMSLKRP